ncbi:MAG: ParB/RepB/Spo0J family partition protein [Lachnospiraceae bacterium]|nr:ParB/RepB/Spo0J family partition protein [Lachnospiraceae bacterium]
MAKGFSIMDMMSEISREEAAEGAETIVSVSVFDIQPNKDNFYELSNMEQLKNSIFSMGGVQQNLLLVRLPANEKYKYKAIAGHRRIRACIELVQEGNKEFEYVPAVIKENIDNDTEDMLLIMTNSTQRELTDWEKVMQHMKLKEIIPKLKKRQGLDGKTRTLEADYLGVSEGQIAIYNTIGTRLDSWLMSMFKEGAVGISLAYEAAKLESEMQKQRVQITINKGSFTEEDIEKLQSSSPIKGQMKITEEGTGRKESKKVTESDTCEKVQEEAVPAAEKVTESDTCADILRQGTELEKTHAKLRGGYSLDVIDDQIRKYEGYLNMLNNDKGRKLKAVAVYNCMLDALGLLKTNLLMQWKEGDACEEDDI